MPAVRLLSPLLLALSLGGLSATAAAQTASSPISLPASVPFAEDAIIKQAIRTDCNLPNYLAGQLAQQFQAQGVPQAPAGQGARLEMEITDAVSEGNAFLGHRKNVMVKGKLVQNGAVVASFIGRRDSMGGVFAGFKGSCVVLERCADALAEDIAGWARAPTMKAQLGNLR